MYLARFLLDRTTLEVAALAVDPAAPWLLPRAGAAAVLEARDLDLALRFRRREGRAEAVILLGAARGEGALREGLERLAGAAPGAARVAPAREEFDRLTGALPPHQLRVWQGGYWAGREPVAADFRLLPLLDWLGRVAAPGPSGPGDILYQVNLRPHRPGPEEARAVRKYLAALRLDSPFPAELTALQTSLAGRVLEPGYVAEEYLAVGDPGAAARVRAAVADHFAETMGRLGFDHPPVEEGRFDELLESGLTAARFGEERHFLERGAALLTRDDVRRLLEAPPPWTEPAPAAVGGAPAPVFLSYSSRDTMLAQSTRRHLEAAGIGVWMAPGSILPGEAYPEAIIRGITGCRALVVLLSAASNLSPHVLREIERALHRGAVVIPFRVEEVEPLGGLEYLLSTCQWLDGFGGRYEAALGELVARLRAVLRVPGAETTGAEQS